MAYVDRVRLSLEDLASILNRVDSGELVCDIAPEFGLTYDALRKRISNASNKKFSKDDKPGTHDVKMLQRQVDDFKKRLLAETIKSSTTREVLARRPDLVSWFLPFLDETDKFWIKSDNVSIDAWINKLEELKSPPQLNRFQVVYRRA